MAYILSWSLFCFLHSRSSWRTCCWGGQAFFSLSKLLRSTLWPGRLSNRRSRGTEDSRRDERDWKIASSHRVTSGYILRDRQGEFLLKIIHSSGHIIRLDKMTKVNKIALFNRSPQSMISIDSDSIVWFNGPIIHLQSIILVCACVFKPLACKAETRSRIKDLLCFWWQRWTTIDISQLSPSVLLCTKATWAACWTEASSSYYCGCGRHFAADWLTPNTYTCTFPGFPSEVNYVCKERSFCITKNRQSWRCETVNCNLQ